MTGYQAEGAVEIFLGQGKPVEQGGGSTRQAAVAPSMGRLQLAKRPIMAQPTDREIPCETYVFRQKDREPIPGATRQDGSQSNLRPNSESMFDK
jgi:hypothetical protein